MVKISNEDGFQLHEVLMLQSINAYLNGITSEFELCSATYIRM